MDDSHDWERPPANTTSIIAGLGQFMAVLTTMQPAVADRAKDNEESSSESSGEDNDGEPFVLRIEEYPVPLQLVYHLLVRNTKVADPDMRYYLLDAARMLCLHADVLASAARKKNKRFVAHCQEPLLVGILWTILDAAHSQVSQVTNNGTIFYLDEQH